ncbi:PD-(D/E)XK nuclease domain-containing protein [Saccharolobus shibatae]|uniref:Uncharacterized protein n=1 Tax=Saccharolobus shibatae TaxID=2286 RepID=A0A8F5C0S0_9CREN|nr:PD-(D/E)XK nuclease domain-containing protein [Saccharolobus shibatae]QXJ34901.1 hypothetical protein J5U22_01448 [Saccharolobus shibatae]
MNKIFQSPTYEKFLRSEFFRVLAKNGYAVESEYPINYGNISLRADLVVLEEQSTPHLVLEFKSQYDPSAITQVRTYKQVLNPHFYGVVYGKQNYVKVELFDRYNNMISSNYIKMGNPYLNDDEVIRAIGSHILP